MKLNLKKKSLKNLSKDKKALPMDMTPQVAGGAHIEVTNFRQCVVSEPNWGCTGGACQD